MSEPSRKVGRWCCGMAAALMLAGCAGEEKADVAVDDTAEGAAAAEGAARAGDEPGGPPAVTPTEATPGASATTPPPDTETSSPAAVKTTPAATATPSPAKAAGPSPTPPPTISAAAGPPAAFNSCKPCHAVVAGGKGVGPTLFGVLGRPAGAQPGYAYSEALKNSGLVWNRANLDKYLAAPVQTVPGTKMAVGLRNEAQRTAVIDYLATLK